MSLTSCSERGGRITIAGAGNCQCQPRVFAAESCLECSVRIIGMVRIDLLVVVKDLVMTGGSNKLEFSGIAHDGVCGDGVMKVL